uniref:Cytochrome P450 3037B1 n=1 Tax=Paracyclopina nana TaxID=565004 RepID=A0A0F7J1T9_PARNA|nr:cytochrome P450 3037B1 [Paracyclopina nana]
MIQIIAAIFAILISVVVFFKKPRKFPPGPPAIPFFGSVFFVPHLPGLIATAATWFINRYHSKIVGLYLGRFPIVAIYDFEVAKEIFSRDDLTGRPDNVLYRFRTNGKNQGLMFADGNSWKSHRRFSLKTLRDFGFGKSSLESVLIEEADRMGEFFLSQKDEPFLVQTLFNLVILNVLWTIVAGKRYELSDPKAQGIVRLITESVQVENLRFLFNMPWVRYLFPQASGWNTQKKIIGDLRDLVGGLVDEHKSNFDTSDMRDFMDVYLREMDGRTEFNEEALIVTAMDLFAAGSETTATTLSWAVLYMILYPDVQAKVYKEISEVLGDREPTLEDRSSLPYTDACIMEIQRLGSIAPMAVPHRALKDVEVKGYRIPKDTLVFSVLYHILRDPDYWPDPNAFKPERFLTPDGSQVIKEERFIPFGVGKRYCLGESLAKAELFIILTRLLQKFSFHSAPGHPVPSDQPVFGFIYAPKPFHAVTKARQ